MAWWRPVASGHGGSATEGKNNTLRRRTISPTHGYVHTARTPTARRGGTGRKSNASLGGSPTAQGLAGAPVGGCGAPAGGSRRRGKRG